MSVVLPIAQYVEDEYRTPTASLERDYYTFDILPVVHGGAYLVEGVLAIEGTITDEDIENHTGSVGDHFYADWYERIHVIPAQLNLGNVLTTQDRPVVLWNAFFNDRNVTGFDADLSTGITVQVPRATPYVLGPLGYEIYLVQVSIDGPPNIAAELTFEVDGKTLVAPITGVRVVVWPFPPNWSSPVNEVLEGKSSLFRSRDGTEQRAALRTTPRRMFEYRSTLATLDDGNYMQSLLMGWQGRTFALPVWIDRTLLAADVASGNITLEVEDASQRGFAVGFNLALYINTREYETGEIEAIDGNLITLKRGVSRTWFAGTHVYPVNVATLELSTTASFLTDRYAEISTRFKVLPEQEGNVQLDDATPMYRDYELFDHRHNWQSPVQIQVQQDAELTDYGYGRFRMSLKSDVPLASWQHVWHAHSRAEKQLIRNFFARRKGRTLPAFMPAHTTDLRLAVTSSEGSEVFDAHDNSYGALMGASAWRKDVLIHMRDGTKLLHEVTAARSIGEGLQRITISPPLDVTITPENVRRITFMGLARMTGDSVTISHISDEVATVQTSFTWIKQP